MKQAETSSKNQVQSRQQQVNFPATQTKNVVKQPHLLQVPRLSTNQVNMSRRIQLPRLPQLPTFQNFQGKHAVQSKVNKPNIPR